MFTFFGIHSVLWLVRSTVDVIKHGRVQTLVPGHVGYERFSAFHRRMHALLAISFLGLAATGLPLKYSDMAWAQALAHLMGGFSSTSFWHRVFALTTFACFFIYCGIMVVTVRARLEQKKSLWTLFFGPESPLPTLRDVRDFFGMLRWFVGLGPKPSFERWTYWEKFDFWGALADILVIGGTGLILWFPGFFLSFLPGNTVNVAKVIHSTQALLATGFVFAVHFFNTHLRADKFPADMSMLTGLVSEEEMARRAARPAPAAAAARNARRAEGQGALAAGAARGAAAGLRSPGHRPGAAGGHFRGQHGRLTGGPPAAAVSFGEM